MDQLHWRDRMPKKRMPAAERRQETEMRSISPPLVVSHNWPDTGREPSGRESAPTWAGEPLKTISRNSRNRRTS